MPGGHSLHTRPQLSPGLDAWRPSGGGNDNEEERGVQLRGGRQMVSTLRSLPGDMLPVFTLLMEDKCQVVRIESVTTLTSNCSHQPSNS